jgi:hypothetical protein
MCPWTSILWILLLRQASDGGWTTRELIQIVVKELEGLYIVGVVEVWIWRRLQGLRRRNGEEKLTWF